MIKVTVKPFYYVSHALDHKKMIEISLPRGTPIRDLLRLLRTSYSLPDKIHVDRYTLELFEGDEIRSLMILLNGRNIKNLDWLDTELDHGAVVALFPLVAGG